MKLNLKESDIGWIAGFLDGNGSIITQIVKNEDRKYGFHIRISISFVQKSQYKHVLLALQKQLLVGTLRDRKDGICEYVIVSVSSVESILLMLMPYLRIKKNLAKHVLKIIEYKRNIIDKNQFIEACGLVDETIAMTYSKKRTITKETVIVYLNGKNI